MRFGRYFPILTLLGLVFRGETAHFQTLQDVMLEGDAATGRFRFTPARVSALPGDVLRFTVRSGAPHLIGFDSTGLSAARRRAINGALSDRSSDLRGPLLADPGTTWRMTVPVLPAGEYRFFCLPHFSRRMFGVLVVGSPGRAGP